MTKRVLTGFGALFAVLIGAVVIVGRGDAPERPPTYPRAFPGDPFVAVTKDGLLEDIDYFLTILDEAHADPYRMVTREAFHISVESVRERIRAMGSSDLQLVDAFFLLQEVAAFLEDEHTKVYYNEAWDQSWPMTFPLQLRFVDERVLVVRDLSDCGLPEQSELLEINGRPMADLIGQCWRITNQTLPHFKRQTVEKNFGKWIQSHLKIPPPWRTKYRHDGKEQTVEITGIDTEIPPEGVRQMYRESVLEANGRGVPVLEIPKFYYDDRRAYDEFMTDFFAGHNNEPAIVIDLRKNPGGDGRWAYAVLDYLTDESYVVHKRFDFRISKPFIDVARYSFRLELWEKKWPRLLWWLPRSIVGENKWMDKVEAAKIGEYAIARGELHHPDSNKSTYRGHVYLLVSHQTNSAAVVFASIFAHHGMGTAVGQETGGRTSFTSDSIPVVMPNTQLFVWIPVAILQLPGGDSDQGFVPDVLVDYTAEDYLRGRDKDLQMVGELISQGG